jgi:hypothetical protein
MMDVMTDNIGKKNLDEEWMMSMEVVDRRLEKIRFMTRLWDSWDEKQKTPFVDEDFQVLDLEFPKEREAMSIVANIMEQWNSFEDISSIICEECLGHHFTKYCSMTKQVSAWK